jgi:hypothetical protein
MKVKIISDKLVLGKKDEVIDLDNGQAESLIKSGHVKEVKAKKKAKDKK